MTRLAALVPDSLDVERLARAIQWDETPVGATLPPIQPFIVRAERLIRLYLLAALREGRTPNEDLRDLGAHRGWVDGRRVPLERNAE